MRIGAKYSHMNGEEFLLIHREKLWLDIINTNDQIDYDAVNAKQYRKLRMQGQMVNSPTAMNNCIKETFKRNGWEEVHSALHVTAGEVMLLGIGEQSSQMQGVPLILLGIPLSCLPIRQFSLRIVLLFRFS